MLLLGRLLWPRLTAPPPLPGHLAWPIAALAWLTVAAKVVAIPLTVAGSAAAGTPTPAFAVLATALALGITTRRSAHVGSGQLIEDAVFLTVTAVGLAGLGRPSVVLVAVPVALALLAGSAAALWWGWGRRPRAVWMRRPTFRILGDNPDALTAVARVRVDAAGWVLHLRDLGEGPVTVAILDPVMRPVAHLGWADLEPGLRREGHLAVGLGPAGPGPQLVLAPGRYWLSTRFYGPRDRDAAPPTLARYTP